MNVKTRGQEIASTPGQAGGDRENTVLAERPQRQHRPAVSQLGSPVELYRPHAEPHPLCHGIGQHRSCLPCSRLASQPLDVWPREGSPKVVERHPRAFVRELRNAREDRELRKRLAAKAEFASTTIR